MNILMMTNTYKPILGGLERSIEIFTNEYRKRGHHVIIVTPRFKNMPKDEKDIVRVPALQNFNGTDFSVQLPIPAILSKVLKTFNPDIIHSHHPFLIGDAALRVSALKEAPIVFTYHTSYEHNTHYVPGDSPALKRFVIRLARGYANLCDHVFVPSESIGNQLLERGVRKPIDVVPTGIYVDQFSRGHGQRFRAFWNIPPGAFVVGYVGRVSLEKNLIFLAEAVAQFLLKSPGAYFLLVGQGPLLKVIKTIYRNKGLSDRFISTGALKGQSLIDGYHACDVFAFASHSETQGLVLAEAMACGLPVVAVNAPGVREIVADRKNGRLLNSDHGLEFSSALEWVAKSSLNKRKSLSRTALATAKRFSVDRCVERALELYSEIIQKGFSRRRSKKNPLGKTTRLMKTQWNLMVNLTGAGREAMIKRVPDSSEM